MIYKLTLDSNLMLSSEKIAGMEILKRWKEEGKVDLLEADPPKTATYGWPGAAPKPVEEKSSWGRPKARSKKMAESGNATFNSIAAVLFPGKDPHKLNMTEINNVAHLIRHHANKNEIFVTANTKSFIEGGRRELLKSYFGIIAMTPEEAVRMLGELEGWKSA